MAIDKAALRKGTRWIYLLHEVEVLEASDAFVVFCEPNGLAEAAPTEKFLAGAHDPAVFEHDHLLCIFNSWGPTMQPREPQEISRAIAYLLIRLGPPAPKNVVPPAPAPKPAPVVVEDLPTVEPYPEADYAVAMPALPEEGEPCPPATFDRPSPRKGKSWAA